MVDNKFSKEIVKPETHGDSVPSAVENPLRVEASLELSSAPKSYQEKGIQLIENQQNDRRNSLPTEKLDAVRAIEKLIVNADSKGLTDYIHRFAGQPVQYEDAMNTVVHDLMSVGLRTSWNYSTRKNRFEPNYDPTAPKEIGNFNLEMQNPVGITTLKYSTEGGPVVHSTETEATNGNVDMNELAHSGLRRSANIWLKQVMD